MINQRTKRMQFKKHAEARHVVFTMGKLIHSPTFSLPLALEEKKEAMQKDGDKIEELEQTLSELRGEISAGRHIPPRVRVLSLSTNPAQDWADLRQAALDRLTEENAALLQRLFAFEASGTHSVPPATAAVGDRSSITTELVPRASWAPVCQEKAQLEDELRRKEKRMLRLGQVFAAETAEFRKALLVILGVKVAFYDNRQVRVMSQYDLGAAFVFQPAPRDAATKDSSGGSSNNSGAARMQLVAQGEGGPQELPQLMRNRVEIVQSIPVRDDILGGWACIYSVAHNILSLQ
jgi:mitotic spindle assembly checkpoint protein MAD1